MVPKVERLGWIVVRAIKEDYEDAILDRAYQAMVSRLGRTVTSKVTFCRSNLFCKTSLSALLSQGRSADRAVDHRLVDHALLDAPLRRDGPVLTGRHQMLQRLPQRLRQRRALGHRPAVRRGVERPHPPARARRRCP